MKKWALLTVALYVMILLILAWPVVWLCFIGDMPHSSMTMGKIYGSIFEAIAQGDYDHAEPILASPWTVAAGMGLAQIVLLVVPVRVESRRPVTTRWLVWPVLAGLMMLVVLTTASVAVAYETVIHTKLLREWNVWTGVMCLVIGVWSLWAFLFGFYTVRGGRQGFMKRLCRSLIAGSILELLIAVPAHVLARTRNYCCAGFNTFWGIAAGISVMLFAFGPAVFVLFARRYGNIRKPPARHGEP